MQHAVTASPVRPAHSPWLDLHPPRSVVVFRALQVGDMLCAVPALRALRRKLPRARIALVGLPWARQLAERLPELLDEFIAFPGHPGLPEQVPDPRAFRAFLHSVQARRFDLALQLHGSGLITNPLVAQFGTRWQAGFQDGGAASSAHLPYPEHGHEIQRLLALTTHLGAPAQGEQLVFPLGPDDADELAQAGIALPNSGQPYVCLHPGARDERRRWPVTRFAELGDALAAQGLRVVLTGSQQEKPLTTMLAAAMRAPVLDTASSISLGALGHLLRGAQLLVSNDTGVSHLAAALEVPSVVVFRASEMARWAPLDASRHRAVWDPEGVRGQTVLDEALALLATA
ncbi:glycosyltransferase family 9 protein [Chitiniphilus purpureus]|uniref:Glycosyltransferase family 9 protein n=1 Tax=Chitiniphilus purpureus TaxID=2981137 RepID=A0ABY6DPL3_9NEIS|nr:glycosyltransferase family 9 protein [Chitiniphilus sp. CD1]UXY16305.1 glycosyltransferase family 9 protein [Chitiniphilus sp. CD1]